MDGEELQELTQKMLQGRNFRRRLHGEKSQRLGRHRRHATTYINMLIKSVAIRLA